MKVPTRMHNVDYASRGYWITTPAADCPNQGWCFTQGLGPYGSGLLSAFQSEADANIGDDRVYPTHYSCTSDYAGVPFSSIYNDYVFYAGRPAIQSFLWHLGLLNSSTRLLDCQNVCCIENCSNANTFFKHLTTKARDPWNTHWQTVFEVSKAFHNRITDANPQITCNGGVVQIGDPDNDTFPWADDMTNITFYAPLFTLNNPPLYDIDTAVTRWGTAKYGPDTCTSTSPTSCKRLALDFTWDMDKWGLVARAGEEYFLKTTNDHLEVDTKMEIRDAAGNAVVNQCGASGTSACLNDDCPSGCSGSGIYCSCLTFKPTTSAVYRVYVYPYHSTGGWNSEVGSNAKYSLTIDQMGDDFGDTYDAATPVPPDGQLRLAHLNSNDPEDYDWFYVVLPANDTLSYGLCSLDGTFQPLLNLYDQNRNFIRSYWGSDCFAMDSVSLTKGLYYARIWNPGMNYGAYLYRFQTTGDIGNTTGTAFNLYDPGVAYPNAVRAVPSVLSSATDKDVFRFWAAQGEMVQLDVEANFNSEANPMMKIVTPVGAYTSNFGGGGSACVNGSLQKYLSGPPYIVRDSQGGVVRDDTEIQKNSHIAMTAPRSSYYYVEVSNQSSNDGGYVLHFYPTGLVLGSPDLP